MSITLDDIDAAEGAVKNVRVVLQTIGREIYKMREGEELGSEYGFDSYRRVNFSGSHYWGEDGPDWGVGTPIFSLTYYWSRAENSITVTFPQGWLEADWRALESERLAGTAREKSVRDAAEAAERKAKREAADLRTYERLKAKFAHPTPGDSPCK